MDSPKEGFRIERVYYTMRTMNANARLMTALISACAAAAFTAGAAAAQEPPPTSTPSPAASAPPNPPSDPCGSILSIVNRPTIGTGVCTVRPGHFDIETGYTNTVTTGAGGGNGASYPQALVRVGTFAPHLDFEFSPPNYNRASAGGVVSTGWSDIALGAKYELGYTSKGVWGVNGVVTLPTGTRAFSAGNAQFTGNFNWGYTLNSEFGLSGTLGFNAFSAYNAGGVAQSYFAFVPTVLMTAALPGGPSQLFAEYAYFTQAGVGLGPKNFFDFGYQRALGPHFQLDVEYGFSPTLLNGQKQHYVGAGLSFMN